MQRIQDATPLPYARCKIQPARKNVQLAGRYQLMDRTSGYLRRPDCTLSAPLAATKTDTDKFVSTWTDKAWALNKSKKAIHFAEL